MEVRPGIGNSAAFQVSGWPFITSSYLSGSTGYVKVEFPSVTNEITIYNKDANAVFPYNLTGSCPLLVFFGTDLTGTYPPDQVTKNHAIEIPISGSMTFKTKCSQVFIGKKNVSNFGAFSLFSSLTNCSPYDMISGSTRDGAIKGPGVDQ